MDTAAAGGCFDPEFAELSNRLLHRFCRGDGSLGRPRFSSDILHIAVATVAEAGVLVSWKFRIGAQAIGDLLATRGGA